MHDQKEKICTCKEKIEISKCKYLGEQQVPHGKFKLFLYECCKCRTTFGVRVNK